MLWPLIFLTAIYTLCRKASCYCGYSCWQDQLFQAPFPHRLCCLVEKPNAILFNSCPSDNWAFCADKCAGNSLTSSFTFPVAQISLSYLWAVASTHSTVADFTSCCSSIIPLKQNQKALWLEIMEITNLISSCKSWHNFAKADASLQQLRFSTCRWGKEFWDLQSILHIVI